MKLHPLIVSEWGSVDLVDLGVDNVPNREGVTQADATDLKRRLKLVALPTFILMHHEDDFVET